jgi:hypothetical protein
MFSLKKKYVLPCCCRCLAAQVMTVILFDTDDEAVIMLTSSALLLYLWFTEQAMPSFPLTLMTLMSPAEIKFVRPTMLLHLRCCCAGDDGHFL